MYICVCVPTLNVDMIYLGFLGTDNAGTIYGQIRPFARK